MNYEIYKAAVTVAVFAAAFLLLCAISKSMELKAEYDEWSTQKNRAKYRAPAYKQMDARWAQHVNREKLWEKVNK